MNLRFQDCIFVLHQRNAAYVLVTSRFEITHYKRMPDI